MTKKRVYFENLDGLRFLCFLSVFFFHSFHSDFDYIKTSEIYHFVKKDLFGNGNLGVNFFFVLSGFLITYLLIEEKKINGNIDIKKFWLRRILRIWPLFYLCVLFGFYGFPILKAMFGQQSNETASIGYYLTFLNNFDFIAKGKPDASILGVLWSVAIEEQFYFIWPIILYLLPIKKYWIAFVSIITLSLFYRAFNDSYLEHEYHTLSCIGDMATGAFGAWLISENKKIKNTISELKSKWIFLLYVFLILIFFFKDEIITPVYGLRIFERQIISLIMILIILEQCFSTNSIFKLSKLKWITKLGTISYGLYCLHFIGILITLTLTKKANMNTGLWEVLVVETTVSLTLTIIISYLTYTIYEKPFLNLKEKFSFITK